MCKTLNQEHATSGDGLRDYFRNALGAKMECPAMDLGTVRKCQTGEFGHHQCFPPIYPSSPINIVHPSKGRRGSYLEVICRYLSCGPYAQGNPEGGLEGYKNG